MSSFILNCRAYTKGTHCEESLYVHIIYQWKLVAVIMAYCFYPDKWDRYKCSTTDTANSFWLRCLPEIKAKSN